MSGVDVLFNSAARGAITARIVAEIEDAVARSAGRRLDLHALIFAFTDGQIARALVAAVEGHPGATVRLLSDWSQLSEGGGRKPAALARLARSKPLPRLQVRFKKDSPYRWDDEAGRPVWSHRTSRGLNHHNGLLILVDGVPERLLTGSFNWSPTAEQSNYENLLVLDGQSPARRAVMRRYELEFEAFWNDGRASLTWDEAREHRRLLLEALEADHDATPQGLEAGAGDDLCALADGEPLEPLSDEPVRVAFSARAPHEPVGDTGYAPENEEQTMLVLGEDGVERPEPATLGAGAVDLIRAVAPSETLELAMYVLSTRTREYGELEAAARRGARLRVVLNGAYNREPIAALQRLADEPGVDVDLRITRRTMHEKFAVHVQGQDLFNGSANLSRSASSRHSEDRFFFDDHEALVAAFRAEFARLWEAGEAP